MTSSSGFTPRKFRAYGRRHLDSIPQISRLPEAQRLAMKAVSAVLPFRVNDYVLELIDWNNIPDDPIFQLTFPQREMLDPNDFAQMLALVGGGASDDEVQKAAREIQWRMNPHPSGQVQLNVPTNGIGQRMAGMQHKYRETVLFFPSQGQTCHAYCTYCFRWAQFVGIDELKFANSEAQSLVDYVAQHPEVTSILITGGDPLVMKTKVLRAYLQPLLDANIPHLESIRIGTKAPAYWPYRFVTDSDADDLMRLFEEVRERGKHLALMAHFTHPRELEAPIVEEAIRRVQRAGAVVRCQSPIVRHVNDSSDAWAQMWKRQIALGAVPYYMFVERDTGPKGYFEVPLVRAYEVFKAAYAGISGLGRTVRGPSMSATPGKVCVEGVTEVGGEQVFVLKFLQARNPAWVGVPFFARFDPNATWFDELIPAFSKSEFFYQSGLAQVRPNAVRSGHRDEDDDGISEVA